MDAEATVRTYYDALRAGDPLAPFFAPEETTVKFGIGERLYGFRDVEVGLSTQTETTDDWTVDSNRLRVTERDGYAWFSDEVAMLWSGREREVDCESDTRWSGTLERRPDAAWSGYGPDPGWRFVAMHVSTPGGTR